MKRLLIVFLLSLPLIGWAITNEEIKSLKKGDPCPKFVFKDLDGANLIAAINSARRKLEDAGLNFQNHILITFHL